MKFENITKENFFNAQREHFPLAVEHFCTWIDKYKELVEWNIIFNDEADYTGTPGNAPKFHDIPYEMQLGIILRYIMETDPQQVQHWDLAFLFDIEITCQMLSSVFAHHEIRTRIDHEKHI